jgi:hypothetical protein
MLTPMVRKAHAMAAKTEANWLRVEMVIFKFLLFIFRIIPGMPEYQHKACQFDIIVIKQ